MSRRIRHTIAAVGALVLGGSLAACSTAPSAESTAVPEGDGPVVAFYGDSYTLGTGASDYTKRWSTVISEQRGWREVNPSVNGLGFINHRNAFGEGSGDLPDIVIAAEPDIVFVTMGLNDNFSYASSADRIHEQITADLTRLHDALPDARFIVVEPFWYTAERPESLAVISGWVEEAAAEIDADYIPGASRWLDGHYAESADSWMASDGLHPDDTGYAHMAEEMDAALAALTPPL
ncbi:lysophospholipase L1-like esterase [Labedella gwakjiensis]|uniref:Lysophospholipase L1-like esterase n=1 Tax=Labedella gwakjiensis TaxID=390269 RepID=A0A2P8GWE5_9MICO|nr:SGNH/GDSL hydrolase family protein [Labedella gwakjiensis]PSL38276.1 lysophospholipase L1-like esterase [Labedella gwakjiensis]RUQ87186.1 SGNH/GDSL hydrolase family protein [Labedella gwakjiensis]